MKGLELAEKFYIEYGEPMLKTGFPHLLPKIAVGSAIATTKSIEQIYMPTLDNGA